MKLQRPVVDDSIDADADETCIIYGLRTAGFIVLASRSRVDKPAIRRPAGDIGQLGTINENKLRDLFNWKR